MPAYLRRLTRTTRDRGASAVEYGLMVAAIAAMIVGVVFGLGGMVAKAFDDTCKSMQTPMGGDCKAPATGTGGGGGGGGGGSSSTGDPTSTSDPTSTN
jgi:pilus assembly protein Flp/PilA